MVTHATSPSAEDKALKDTAQSSPTQDTVLLLQLPRCTHQMDRNRGKFSSKWYHHLCKQCQDCVTPPERRDGGTAGWSTLVLTSGSCHHHLKGCYSCLAGVHSERLWDFGSNSRSQTRSCNLDLAGIHNILHRNLERTAWK